MAKANDVQVGGAHYKKHGALQVWDAIIHWGLGFLDGNVVKYVVRYRDKNGLQDLMKARHYLDKLIEVEQEHATIRRGRRTAAPDTKGSSAKPSTRAGAKGSVSKRTANRNRER